jgi:hypothetical protein
MAKKINVDKFIEKIKGISLEQTEELLSKIQAEMESKKAEEVKSLQEKIAKLNGTKTGAPSVAY